MKKIIPFLVFSFSYRHLRAQKNAVDVTFLLNRIEKLQVDNNAFFLVGSYPSYISSHQKYKTKHRDIDIFYNIVIDATLKKIAPKLDEPQQVLVDSLLARSLPIYHRFKNKERGSYNFWLRDSLCRFPMSWWIPLIKKKGNFLPDDLDDTALKQLAWPDDSLEKLHRIMQQYSHQPGRKIKSTDKKYRKYNAYSTWFGKKFPVMFDVAVLTNILTYVQTYNLPWTKVDSASLQLIVQSIKNGDYINKPLDISPYYGKTAIVLYRFSRLMQVKKIPQLEALKPNLVNEGNLIFNHSKNIFEKIIVANALHGFGENITIQKLPTQAELPKMVEENNYPFVLGNLSSYFPDFLKKSFYKMGALLYYYYCPAYNDVLLLQYLVNTGVAK
ncbi:hypothetical protein [Arachidicoccus sp.]|uniref:hypothetical protein n=1 Tax=Arachidicoccus sp. TaxID=1872624 RepID=UPI003D1DE68B